MRALDFSMSVAAVTHMLMATVLLLALAFAPTHTSQAVQGLNVTTVHAYAPGGAPGGQLGASVAAAGSWGEPRSAVLVRAAAIGQLPLSAAVIVAGCGGGWSRLRRSLTDSMRACTLAADFAWKVVTAAALLLLGVGDGPAGGLPYSALWGSVVSVACIVTFVYGLLAATAHLITAEGEEPTNAGVGARGRALASIYAGLSMFHVPMAVPQLGVAATAVRMQPSCIAQDLPTQLSVVELALSFAVIASAAENQWARARARRTRARARAAWLAALIAVDVACKLLGTHVVRVAAQRDAACSDAYVLVYGNVVAFWIFVGALVLRATIHPVAFVNRIRQSLHAMGATASINLTGSVPRRSLGPTSLVALPAAVAFYLLAPGTGTMLGLYDPSAAARAAGDIAACGPSGPNGGYQGDYDALLGVFVTGAWSAAALLAARVVESRTNFRRFNLHLLLQSLSFAASCGAHVAATAQVAASQRCAKPLWNMLVACCAVFWPCVLMMRVVNLCNANGAELEGTDELMWVPLRYRTLYTRASAPRMSVRTLSPWLALFCFAPVVLALPQFTVAVLGEDVTLECADRLWYWLAGAAVAAAAGVVAAAVAVSRLRFRAPSVRLIHFLLWALPTGQLLLGVSGVVLVTASPGCSAALSGGAGSGSGGVDSSGSSSAFAHEGGLGLGSGTGPPVTDGAGSSGDEWGVGTALDLVIRPADPAGGGEATSLARAVLGTAVIYLLAALAYAIGAVAAHCSGSSPFTRLRINLAEAAQLSDRLAALERIGAGVLSATSSTTLEAAVVELEALLQQEGLLKRQVGRQRVVEVLEHKKSANPELYDWRVSTRVLQMLDKVFGSGSATVGGGAYRPPADVI